MTQLLCPSCGQAHPASERFCGACGVPLVMDSEASRPVSERHERARKVKPQLAEGKLVRVTSVRNQAEGEFIQALLLEEGVPSMLRRSAGFDVPDFLAAGPRDVLVPESGLSVARDVLLQSELISPEQRGPGISPARLLIGLLLALAIGAIVVWALFSLHS